VLGLGVFFLAYYTTHVSTGNGTASVTVLFGSIFGISNNAATAAILIAVGLILVLLLIAPPLLFASLDPAVAAGRGVPVRLLGPLFLDIVGATAAEASQAIGALLLFGLLAPPRPPRNASPTGPGPRSPCPGRSRLPRCGSVSAWPTPTRSCPPASRSWPSRPPSSHWRPC
jgi:zinc/manganese transport system permease protein